MFSPSSLSRRALVAVPALGAVAPAAGNKRKGKSKRQKKPKPPLASALAILTDIGVHDAGSGPTFSCAVEWVVVYPAGPASHRAVFTTNVAGTTTAAQKRAALAAEVRSRAVGVLEARGFDLPGDRIDVALI